MPKLYYIALISVLLMAVSCTKNETTDGYSLSGTVISGGTPLAGVTVSISHPKNGTFTATTDSNGNFSITDLWSGDYTVTPEKTGYIFEPVNSVISINGSSSKDFTGILTWNKVITGSYNARAKDIKITSDGGYIIAGYIDTAGSGYDMGVVKIDKAGSITWEKKFGTGMNDFAYTIIESFNGASADGYVIAGKSETAARSYDARVIKIDLTGTIIWDWDYSTYNAAGYDEINKVIQTDDGGYLLVGKTNSCASCGGFSNAWILKLNNNGTISKDITYGGDDIANSNYYDDYAYDICKTSTGGYVSIGGTKSFPESDKIIKGLFLMYDSALNYLGVTIGSSGYYEEEYKSIALTSDNGFIITGYIKDTEVNSYDMELIKTNSAGTILWRKLIDGPFHNLDRGFSVVQTSDGGYAVAGDTFNPSSDIDMALYKFDSDGNLLWKKIFSSIYNDSAFSLKETADKGFIIAGYSEAAHDSIWVLKTDRNGIIYGYNDNE